MSRVCARARHEIGTTEPERTQDPIPTATLAELFLGQGHPAKAREIYARLAEQEPGDERILRRLAEIEAMLGRETTDSGDDGSMVEWLESLLNQIRKERKDVLR